MRIPRAKSRTRNQAVINMITPIVTQGENTMKKRRLNPAIKDFLILSAFTLASSYLAIRIFLFMIGVDA
jgi:hypothetical protein